MKLKRVKPILVETNEPTNIFKDHSGLFHSNLNLQTGHSINSSVIGYKLILISLEYEKIEVGDTLLLDNEEIVTCIGFDSNPDIIKINCRFERYVHKSHFKKVIATQDKISPEYIAKFVEQYNNGIVKDVKIEMNLIEILECVDKYDYNDIVVNGEIIDTVDRHFTNLINKICNKYNTHKLTNGFVNIVNKEPILYTEEEVYELFNSFRKDFSLYRGIQIMDVQLKDWFEQYKKHN